MLTTHKQEGKRLEWGTIWIQVIRVSGALLVCCTGGSRYVVSK